MLDKTLKQTMQKVAELARLELTQAELDRFSVQLGQVLEYINKLNAVDTSKIEPLSSALEIATPTHEDSIKPSLGSSKLLESAPEKTYDHYKVPQVLGGES